MRYQKGLGIVAILMLTGLLVNQQNIRASSDLADQQTSLQETTVIKGEVVDIQENVFLIKTEDGTIARVRIYRGTVQDQSIVKGDHVEARVLPEWRALVLRQQHQ